MTKPCFIFTSQQKVFVNSMVQKAKETIALSKKIATHHHRVHNLVSTALLHTDRIHDNAISGKVHTKSLETSNNCAASSLTQPYKCNIRSDVLSFHNCNRETVHMTQTRCRTQMVIRTS